MIDFAFLADNPAAIQGVEQPRRASADLRIERLRPAVGKGEELLLEREQDAAEYQRQQHNRNADR